MLKPGRSVTVAGLLRLPLAVAGIVSAPAALGQADEENDDPTGWLWYHNIDVAAMNDRIGDGFRLVDVEIQSGSPLRFNAAFVHNSGSHAKGWWWYYGITAQQVSDYLGQNGARLIDVEVYLDGNGSTRFAVVMIPNSGDDATGWWWYYGVTATQLGDYIDDNNGRLIDLDTYVHGGERRYACVMVSNTGDFARPWWYYYNVSPAFISQKLGENGARLIDIEPHSTTEGTFTVVMQKNTGHHWWWYYGVTADFLGDRCDQYGARIFDLERYTVNGQARFAACLLNNSNPLETDMNDLMRGLTDGSYGCYLKRVGGSVLAGIREDFVFEPASCIKVLHHLHSFVQVQNGVIDLDDAVSVETGMSGSCPIGGNPVQEPLATVLGKMMENSDNARTEAVRQLWGEQNIVNTALVLGMADTDLNHTLGCAGGAIDSPNELTLRDAGILYEEVATGLLSPDLTDEFYDLMLNGMPGALADVIAEEGADLVVTDGQLAAFEGGVRNARKGGSYTLIYDADDDGSNETHEHRTWAGWVELPYKSRCRATTREYVHGSFVNDATDGGDASEAAGSAFYEVVRGEVRAAMASWKACVGDWDWDGVTNTVDFIEFLNDWSARHPACDLDGDRRVDTRDFLIFLNEWTHG